MLTDSSSQSTEGTIARIAYGTGPWIETTKNPIRYRLSYDLDSAILDMEKQVPEGDGPNWYASMNITHNVDTILVRAHPSGTPSCHI